MRAYKKLLETEESPVEKPQKPKSLFSQLEDKLKSSGRYGFIKWVVRNRYITQEKVIPYARGVKGILGGNEGPMTSTDAYLRKNESVEQMLIDEIKQLGGEILSREKGLEIKFSFPDSKKSYSAIWQTYPSYSDNDSYQNYWLTLKVNK